MNLGSREPDLPAPRMRTGLALLLAASLLLVACAPLMSYREVDTTMPLQQSLALYHDLIRITKVDGSQIEGYVWRIDDGGLKVAGHPYVPRSEIKQIEKQQPVPGALAARNAGIVAGASATLVVLPFAVLLSKASQASAPSLGASAASAAAVGASAARSAGDAVPGGARGPAQSP